MPTNRKLLIGALAAIVVALLVVGVIVSRDESDGPSTDAAATTLVPETTSTVVESTTTTSPPETTTTTTTAPAPTAPTVDPQELAALRDAYRQGFEQTCRAIFGLSPDGVMHDPEDPDFSATLDDCLAEMDDTTGEIYDTVQDAFNGGVEDAEFTADGFSFSGRLCSKTGRCWSY